MRPLRTAEILAVGSELLTPFRSDTNSLVLTSRLNDLGISVIGKAIVGDDVGVVSATVRAALSRADLVVLTGGLGPTDDDVTRDAVADAIGVELDEDPAILAAIEARFARRKVPMPAINRRQAMVPRGGVVLPNPSGTAPGLWIERGDRVVVLLPGPPREMRTILDGDVSARLAARSGERRVERRVIRTTGRPESTIDEIASPIYTPWKAASPAIETTILAGGGQIELHLAATSDGTPAAADALDRGVAQLAAALGDVVISTDGRPIEVVVGDALQARRWTIATAESCTGGGIASRLTDIAGSSAYVAGGVIAYADAVKTAALGVPPEMIAAHGAVSEPVAIAMADGARRKLGADVGLSVTGIAGPGGGSAAKPVGTVFIALALPNQPTTARAFLFLGDRALVRAQSAINALDLVRRALAP